MPNNDCTMKSSDLNRLLVSSLPELADSYHRCVDWDEGDDTGSHIVYGEVLGTQIEKSLAEHDDNELNRCFKFIDEVLEKDDEYAENVIAVSVIEYLYLGDLDKEKLKTYLRPKALKIWDDFDDWYAKHRDEKKSK